MEITRKSNWVEVSGVDITDSESVRELGKTCAHECVVVFKEQLTEQTMYETMTQWGDPSRALIHKYVGEKLLTGRHWRELLINLGYISNAVDTFKEGMCRVSYSRNEKGKPTGIFTNGELDWHSDQQSHDDTQRMIGLMSLWGSKGSQTTFLCTNPMYELLNQEDRTMVDELVTVWAWDGGTMSEDLIESQMELVHYHMIPLDGMESPLKNTTASGREGIKFPSHSFSHFKGMTREESLRYREHLWSLLNKPEYIHTQNWEDGQAVFMDQNITLHARPTNVKDGDSRTMSRTVTYMNKIYPDAAPRDYVLFKGQKIPHMEFAQMVDTARRAEYYAEKP